MSMKQIKIYFLLSVLLFIAVISPLPAIAASQPANNYEKAVDLKILGLFAGTPDGFELDRAPTRLEGAVMLLRLLGKENQLNEGAFAHPFTDVPDWADKYIGYMFQNKLTNGVSKTKFGSAEPLSVRQYAVFVLRSLGYSDTADFSYSQAAEKAQKLGLLSDMEASALKNNATFLRNNLVAMSYNALSVKMKDSDTTLLDKLVNTDKPKYLKELFLKFQDRESQDIFINMLNCYLSDNDVYQLNRRYSYDTNKFEEQSIDRFFYNSLYESQNNPIIIVGGLPNIFRLYLRRP